MNLNERIEIFLFEVSSKNLNFISRRRCLEIESNRVYLSLDQPGPHWYSDDDFDATINRRTSKHRVCVRATVRFQSNVHFKVKYCPIVSRLGKSFDTPLETGEFIQR